MLGRARRWSWPLAIGALGALACQLAIQELPAFSYLGPWSLVYQFFIGLVVVAIWLQATTSVLSRGLAIAPLTWLGRNSLTIYFWHLPVFFVVARHVDERPWWVGAALSFAVVAVLVVVLERVLEEPTRRLLASHPLFRRHVEPTGGGAA